LEYKVKDLKAVIHNITAERDKLQYVIDNQLFNMEVYQEYTKNINDNAAFNDKNIDEIVQCKQKIDNITEQIDQLKSQ